jgi:hypothetical protein
MVLDPIRFAMGFPPAQDPLDGWSGAYLRQFQIVEEADFAEFATEYMAPIPKKHVIGAAVTDISWYGCGGRLRASARAHPANRAAHNRCGWQLGPRARRAGSDSERKCTLSDRCGASARSWPGAAGGAPPRSRCAAPAAAPWRTFRHAPRRQRRGVRSARRPKCGIQREHYNLPTSLQSNCGS